MEWSMDALDADDVCSANPSGEACSLALRQLRGIRGSAESALATDADDTTKGASGSANGVVNATGADEGGEEANSFCCYSGADASDACGSCFPTAIAESGSFCASKGNCGGCGGTWCKKRFHCAFSGADSSDICGTAYSTAIAEVGSFCDRSEAQCSECRGKWCPIVVADAPIVPAA